MGIEEAGVAVEGRLGDGGEVRERGRPEGRSSVT